MGSSLSIQSLDRGWEFRRLDAAASTGSWTVVDLPHTPFYTDLDGGDHWQGECVYRRKVQVTDPRVGWRHTLHVGAAMHTARVGCDDVQVARHEGGYLPFEVDLTAQLADGRAHEISLVLDNRDAPDVPPGKALAELDFCWFGGLYRHVELRSYPPVHITDANAAGEPAGGGVFVRTLAASAAEARVAVKVHVRNASALMAVFRIEARLAHDGEPVAVARSAAVSLGAGHASHVELELVVQTPRLWSPDAPVLHDLRVTLCDEAGEGMDQRTVRCGLRRIAFSRRDGFTVNGRRFRLRGTNRHQEHPYVGYAVPPAAQRRDARRIKEAGFDYVRLSHYPQAPEFLDACDELGIVVMNCIPGWQFIGGDAFREACDENARQLVRRDRNHPCVVLWELSLNETAMDEAFMARLHAIGHEEFPGDQMFTCGWIDRFDVFIHSRQHGEIHRWQNGDKALVVAEYGDWEYYAANEGFDQTTGAGLLPASSNSRQRRGAGERALLQQAENHSEALNDTLGSPAVLDGQWTMFDYVRGYHEQRAACGVMDLFRLPKFSYYFYRSQRDAGEGGAGWRGDPMVFIASHWLPESSLRVTVFSNCDRVELSLNGRVVERRAVVRTPSTRHLPHPPMIFELPAFEPGTLVAQGFIGGRPMARHQVSTPGATSRLTIEVDDLGLTAPVGEPDLLIVHASLRDTAGVLVVGECSAVTFTAGGAAELIGGPRIEAEAGVASALLRIPADSLEVRLEARLEARPEVAAEYRWTKPGGIAADSKMPAGWVE